MTDTTGLKAKELTGLTIVVADDEKDYVTTLFRFLSEKGATVLPCCNGTEAFEKVTTQPVDLLLTDLRMPNGTGIELLRRIRRSKGTLPKHPAIIVNTGYLDGGESYLKSLGAEEIFLKPVSLVALVATMVKLVT